jgi:hypothetical protein
MANKPHNTPTQSVPATPSDAVPNQAAPRKQRTPGIKYTKIINSKYVEHNGDVPTNPLDQLAETAKGGLKFPGVVFEKTIFGTIVKIPGRQTAIKNPTVRQVFEVLDEIYKA